MNKRLAGTGLAIGLVAGAGAGLVLELSGSANASPGVAAVVPATDDTTPDTTAPDSTTPDTTAPDATAPDASTPAPPEPGTKLQDILQPLIDDGTITQAQADKIIAALQAAGPIGRGGPFGGHHMAIGPKGFGLDVVANALGITADEVRTALQNGQSIADLAVSKGKTAQDVIDAVVADVTTKLNERVTAGDLTQAQADKIIADVKDRAADFVNKTLDDFPFMGGMGMGKGGPWMGGPGRHHPDNDGDADDNPSSGTPADTTPTTVTG
jgi:polyhydroxyalkanoate synthesis regulator phasin